jgi:hypothetical protein
VSGGCICGSDEPCVGRCEKHDRDLHGYPCGDCQREWREANPKRAAEIARIARRALRHAGSADSGGQG